MGSEYVQFRKNFAKLPEVNCSANVRFDIHTGPESDVMDFNVTRVVMFYFILFFLSSPLGILVSCTRKENFIVQVFAFLFFIVILLDAKKK